MLCSDLRDECDRVSALSQPGNQAPSAVRGVREPRTRLADTRTANAARTAFPTILTPPSQAQSHGPARPARARRVFSTLRSSLGERGKVGPRGRACAGSCRVAGGRARAARLSGARGTRRAHSARRASRGASPGPSFKARLFCGKLGRSQFGESPPPPRIEHSSSSSSSSFLSRARALYARPRATPSRSSTATGRRTLSGGGGPTGRGSKRLPPRIHAAALVGQQGQQTGDRDECWLTGTTIVNSTPGARTVYAGSLAVN